MVHEIQGADEIPNQNRRWATAERTTEEVLTAAEQMDLPVGEEGPEIVLTQELQITMEES